MTDERQLRQTYRLLESYIWARNARRSAEKAADGFVAGKRIHALKESHKAEQAALLALAEWVEAQARLTLKSGKLAN